MSNSSPFLIEKEKKDTLRTLKLNNLSDVRIDYQKEELQLVDKNNVIHLLITFTENGLELSINASTLKINVSDQLDLSGKNVNIHALQNLSIVSHGSMTTEVSGNTISRVQGDNENVARTQKITSTHGNIEMKANDNVKVEGERVLLNCD